MRCAWCRHPLDDVHGHGACLNNRCPMFGLNQDECCSGETGDAGEGDASADEDPEGPMSPPLGPGAGACVKRRGPADGAPPA